MARISPSERLLNLVIALLNARRRMTRAEIRATVAGYDNAASDAAFERMFERDKETLRVLGIPLTTVGQAGAGDEVGYLVESQAWPMAEIDLTPAEVGVLSLAARMWRNQTITADAVRGVSKLRALGAQEGEIPVGLTPRLGDAGAYLQPLLDAIAARQVVTFRYRAATTGETTDRTVQPWQLYTYAGGWYLLGFDTGRGKTRSFRLSRIQKHLKVADEIGAFPAPSHEALEAARGRTTPRTARLALSPDRAHALRARASGTGETLGGRDIVTIQYADPDQLADELVGYGDGALVLDPPDVRDLVIGRLRAAAKFGGPDA